MDKDERFEESIQELLDALMKGAIATFSDSGEIKLAHLDDLPPRVRECMRASVEHRRQCPDCLEDEAQSVQMDADSHREDGNGQDAQLPCSLRPMPRIRNDSPSTCLMRRVARWRHGSTHPTPERRSRLAALPCRCPVEMSR
jgi:hypothetical protein